MSLGIPEVAVATFVLGNGEVVFVVVVHGEEKRDLTVAAIVVDVMVGVDGAMVEGHVHVVGVVLPTIGVARCDMFFNVEAGSEFKIEG